MSLKHIHHHTWFPFVLVGLSFTLVLLVIFFVAPRGGHNPFFQKNETVNQELLASEYKQAMIEIHKDFFIRLESQSDTSAKIQIIDDVINKTLALLVPTVYRDMHLEIVLALNLMRQGVAGNESALAQGRDRLESLSEQYTWLK